MNFLNVLLLLFANYGQNNVYHRNEIDLSLNQPSKLNHSKTHKTNEKTKNVLLKQGLNENNQEAKIEGRKAISLDFTPTRIPGQQMIPSSVDVGNTIVREHLRIGESRLVEGCDLVDTRIPCNNPDQTVSESDCNRWKCCWNSTEAVQCAQNKYYFTRLRHGPDYSTCGKVTADLPSQETSLRPLLLAILKGRIIGGTVTTEGSFPWMAYLYIRQLGFINGGICGGSLISNQWVITAAHCIETSVVSLYGVILGEHTLSLTTNNEIFRTVERIVIHPNFNLATFNNDIALIKLSSPVLFNAYVRPICVVPTGTRTDSNEQPTYAGTNCVTLGWGLTSSPGGVTSDVLMELRQIISPEIACQAITGDTVAIGQYGNRAVFAGQSKFCAGGVLNEDTCEGDSGGPLMCQNDDGTYYLHGITSYGTIPCALQGLPGVFTKVTDFSTWIDTTITLP